MTELSRKHIDIFDKNQKENNYLVRTGTQVEMECNMRNIVFSSNNPLLISKSSAKAGIVMNATRGITF